jgi:DNA-binding transcriptional LysR family regulator
MRDLNDIAIFVRVAQQGSFSRAAQALGMPVSTVSRRVSALEDELGVTLLQRSTRKLSLTAQGRAYLDQCSEPLNELQDAERALTQAQREPEGLLRLSVPVILGQAPFFAFLSAFMRAHQGIRVDLQISNAFVDLIGENIDVAIRYGDLHDSSLVARPIGTSVRHVVATPGYLEGRKLPQAPADLASHACVMINARNNEAEWVLLKGRRSARVRVSGPMASHDFNSVSAFVYAGHGIGFLPSAYCDGQVARGELVRLLPAWSSPVIPVHAVYPTRRFTPRRLQVFLEALAAWQSPSWRRA